MILTGMPVQFSDFQPALRPCWVEARLPS